MAGAEVAIPVRGPYALAASARFLARFTPLGRPDASADPLRLAFSLDGTGEPSGIALRQSGDEVRGVTIGGAPAAVAAQAARILSLDVDGAPLEDIAREDAVAGDLIARFGALRPVLFPSPFEAGVWAILTQRTRMDQAVRLRGRLAEGRATAVPVDGGDPLPAFPPPSALVDVEDVPGLPMVKVEWLRELARAAEDGFLDAGRLRAMEAPAALAELRELPGVGAFSAELILARGAGAPDVLPLAEPRLRRAVAEAYALPAEPDADRLERIAEAWRPRRAWIALLLRASLRSPR